MKSLGCLLLSMLCAIASAQAHYETRAIHDPDGVGKFYMGREIAWLERDERETEERPTQAIAAFDIKPGDTVVDLGAGSGYYSFRVAPLVGKQGRVLAVDIEDAMLHTIRERAAREKVDNIATIRSTADDPRLPTWRTMPWKMSAASIWCSWWMSTMSSPIPTKSCKRFALR